MISILQKVTGAMQTSGHIIKQVFAMNILKWLITIIAKNNLCKALVMDYISVTKA